MIEPKRDRVDVHPRMDFKRTVIRLDAGSIAALPRTRPAETRKFSSNFCPSCNGAANGRRRAVRLPVTNILPHVLSPRAKPEWL